MSGGERRRDGGGSDTLRDLTPLTDAAETPGAPATPTSRPTQVAFTPGPSMPAVRRFRLTVLEGPGQGTVWESTGDHATIGSHSMNDVVIDDKTVSRFHCELRMDPVDGARVIDLNSRNGTYLDGNRIRDAWLRGGSVLRMGLSAVRFDFGADQVALELSEKTRFGALVGGSVVMRAAYALLERAAASDATVLLDGETGTGKGAAAESIHRAGARSGGPFIVIDCSAIPGPLLESELFGHEKGAFTGADARRLGAFEEASGGTIFLDEVGELPPDLQPKLLRALENREIRRVGSNTHKPVDVRVIAATNRDLRAEVNAGRFRADLYFRLAVLKITLPPLRARPEDLDDLIAHLLDSLKAPPARAARLKRPERIEPLRHAAWPGNVRELRNYVERALVFDADTPEAEAAADAERAAQPPTPAAPAGPIDASVPYAEAREKAIEAFERSYLEALLALHGGKVAQAAAAAGINRVYLYRLLRRHGLKGT